MAVAISRRFGHWSLEDDDVVQLAMIAVMNAIDSYDTARGCKLSTYVFRRVEWYLADEIGSLTRRTRRTGELPVDLADASRDSADAGADDASDLWDAIDGLEPHRRSTLISYYGMGNEPPMTMTAIGQRIGRSHSTVGVSLETSRRLLRAALTA
jgi:RNA polymerase sigma factor (sigma-70 family)